MQIEYTIEMRSGWVNDPGLVIPTDVEPEKSMLIADNFDLINLMLDDISRLLRAGFTKDDINCNLNMRNYVNPQIHMVIYRKIIPRFVILIAKLFNIAPNDFALEYATRDVCILKGTRTI